MVSNYYEEKWNQIIIMKKKYFIEYQINAL